MDNKKIFFLVLGIVAFFLIIRITFYEKRPVSTENWNKQFFYDSEDPYGTYVLQALIKQKYGEEKVLRNYKDTLLSKIDSDNNLYILCSHNAYLSSHKQEQIQHFIAKGNQALIISKNRYYLLMPKLNDLAEDTQLFASEHDSIYNFSFTGFSDTLSYKHYSYNHDKATLFYPNEFRIAYDSSIVNLAGSNKESSIFFKTNLDTGVIFQHVFPELFSNIAAKQDFYLNHFNGTFNHLKGDLVIIDHPIFDESLDDGIDRSPIQYILGERSLKWAYYIFLFTTLAFLFFRGKRKQRIIPIPEKNENTSIQYVDTLSNLFEQQNQNEKLVPHMQTVFMQRVKKKYYLTPDNENFVAVLSKKSRIPENQITAILNYFRTGSSDYSFSDDQLIMLHQRLEDFYNNAE